MAKFISIHLNLQILTIFYIQLFFNIITLYKARKSVEPNILIFFEYSGHINTIKEITMRITFFATGFSTTLTPRFHSPHYIRPPHHPLLQPQLHRIREA